MTSNTEFIAQTMINQPVINIGMIGHVANGKSTITEDISGESTQRHSAEKKKNRTIKLGYANAKIYKCPQCNPPECYQSTSSDVMEHRCIFCQEKTKLIIHVSFADCPGHHDLMATMLNGTCIMDCCILVESVTNNDIPASQTGVKVSMVCINKMDLMLSKKQMIYDSINRIRKFVNSGTECSEIPIIPVSGTMPCNIDVVCEYISHIDIPIKNLTDNYKMLIVRSFNINSERIPINELNGGVIGGSIVRGLLRVNDPIVIYPGFLEFDEKGIWKNTPLYSKIISIQSEQNNLDYAISGGLIAIQLDIDSALTGADGLIGQVAYSDKEKDVKVYIEITIKYKNRRRLLANVVNAINFMVNTVVQINANANNINAKIKSFDKDILCLLLSQPICLEKNDLVSVSKLCHTGIDICGYGIFVSGIEI